MYATCPAHLILCDLVTLEAKLMTVNLLQMMEPQPQVLSSTQDNPVSPHSSVAPQSPAVLQSPGVNIPSEYHMVQTPPAEEEEEEDTARSFDAAAEDTGYSAIALYDYQAGGVTLTECSSLEYHVGYQQNSRVTFDMHFGGFCFESFMGTSCPHKSSPVFFLDSPGKCWNSTS
jgi:hypothetical protein